MQTQMNGHADTARLPTTPLSRLASYSNLSTGHLSEDVARALDSDTPPVWTKQVIRMGNEYGWFIKVPPQSEVPDEPLANQPVDPKCYWSIPESLRACFEVARADGADWIHFDRDEEIIDELRAYQW